MEKSSLGKVSTDKPVKPKRKYTKKKKDDSDPGKEGGSDAAKKKSSEPSKTKPEKKMGSKKPSKGAQKKDSGPEKQGTDKRLSAKSTEEGKSAEAGTAENKAETESKLDGSDQRLMESVDPEKVAADETSACEQKTTKTTTPELTAEPFKAVDSASIDSKQKETVQAAEVEQATVVKPKAVKASKVKKPKPEKTPAGSIAAEKEGSEKLGKSVDDKDLEDQKKTDEKQTDDNGEIKEIEGNGGDKAGEDTEGKEKEGEREGEELGKFVCTRCNGYQGKNKASLLKHLKNHHGIFQCSHCEFASDTKEAMDEHMKSHPSSKWGKRKCPKCIRFIDPDDFEEHEKVCTGKPEPFVCPQCKREFKFKALAESHMKTHLPKEPVEGKSTHAGHGAKKCPKCSRKYWPDEFEQHLKTCDGTRVNFVCPECKKEFKFMAKLRNHMKIHLKHEDMEFACDQCEYVTPFFGYLEKHMTCMHDENREKTVPCSECQKLFYTESNMQNHLKYSCVKIDPHTCEKCGKVLKSSNALKKHMITHQEEKPVTCEVDGCALTFKTKRLLTYHKKSVHSDEIAKKFTCPHPGCQEEFIKKSQLNRHEITHDGQYSKRCSKVQYLTYHDLVQGDGDIFCT